MALTGIEIAMLANAGINIVSGLGGLLFGSNEDDKRGREAGATAKLLQDQLVSSIGRRLAGTPSVTARALASQAVAGEQRRTTQLQEQLGREAQRRGIAGTGIGLESQRLAAESGQRRATAVGRGVELADLRGAEADAANLSQRLFQQERFLKAQQLARDAQFAKLLGTGARLGGYVLATRAATPATATPSAQSTAPGMVSPPKYAPEGTTLYAPAPPSGAAGRLTAVWDMAQQRVLMTQDPLAEMPPFARASDVRAQFGHPSWP